jgi:hypothetical protein
MTIEHQTQSHRVRRKFIESQQDHLDVLVLAFASSPEKPGNIFGFALIDSTQANS